MIWLNGVFNERSRFEEKMEQRKTERTVECKRRKIKERTGLKKRNKLRREIYRKR
jgi:hypothetical protein